MEATPAQAKVPAPCTENLKPRLGACPHPAPRTCSCTEGLGRAVTTGSPAPAPAGDMPHPLVFFRTKNWGCEQAPWHLLHGFYVFLLFADFNKGQGDPPACVPLPCPDGGHRDPLRCLLRSHQGHAGFVGLASGETGQRNSIRKAHPPPHTPLLLPGVPALLPLLSVQTEGLQLRASSP